MWASSSSARRNKILALATATDHQRSSKNQESTKTQQQIRPKPDIVTMPKLTNMDELWSRPLDFNDHSVVFDYHKEYENSLNQYIHTYDLSKLQLLFNDENNKSDTVSADFLQCQEVIEMSPFELNQTKPEEEVDIFHDSDDDRDKTYSPENSDSDENEIFNERKTQSSSILQDIPIPQSPIDDSNSRSIMSQITKENNLIINELLPLNNVDSTISTQFNIEPENIIERSQDSININIITHDLANTEEDKGLTKDGKPRKRRNFSESVKERQEKKKKVKDELNDMKEPCTERCLKKCLTKFSTQQRQYIHDRYIALDYESQGLFIKCSIDIKPIMRRSQVAENYKRNTTYIYNLKGFDNIKKEVCKTFFLTTLGYKPNNDRRITTAMSKAIDEQKNARGSYKRTVIDREALKDHIMSFHPAISHYRREHAPKKLYLPSDITVTMMHENFCSIRPDIKVSLEVYRKVVRNDLNISFAHLGNEECEQCEYYKRHSQLDHQTDSCEICQNYNMQHKPRYTESRREYDEDRDKAKIDKEVIYYSVDLQKIIMLPRMDQFKTAIFCPRLIAFNESFVPLGPATSDNKPYAVLWNESISGRSQEDIISTFKAFLNHKRDIKNIVFWLDNCSAQNKNWSLFCFMVQIVNSTEINADSITLKYFEPGHTFMSADSFHHQVEKSLTKKGKVYDFNDFVECVGNSNKRKNTVKVMHVDDFVTYEDLSSQHKLRKNNPRIYLTNIMAVRVERGLFKLKYKFNHAEDYKSELLDFLQVKIMKNEEFPEIKRKNLPRGITKERKAVIIEKLVPLMPENRKQFWINVPINDSSQNLLEED